MKAVGPKRFDFLFKEAESLDLLDQGIKTPERRTWAGRPREQRLRAPAFSRHHIEEP